MISDPWIDRSPPAPREFKTPADYRAALREQRRILREANKCINGPLVGTVGRRGIEHGAPVKHGKCARCLRVYEASR